MISTNRWAMKLSVMALALSVMAIFWVWAVKTTPCAGAQATCPIALTRTFSQGVTINEDGADSDSRLEGDTNVNLQYWDATTDSIGLGAVQVTGAFLGVTGYTTNRAGVTSVGRELHAPAGTFTDTNAASTTLAVGARGFIGTPTFAGANASQVITDAFTYLFGAPAAGTNMTLTRAYTVGMDAGTTATLWLSRNTDSTTAAGGLLFGLSRDTNLYRSAANTLRTDDGFVAAGGIDSSVVGGTTAAAGTFTALTGTQNTALQGDISPAQITSNQNDYNPASLSTATILRLSTDASRTITGLAGGADGRVITILNIGSNDLVLAGSSGSSSAANQFSFVGNYTINAEGALTLIYDSTSSRWRIMGAAGAGFQQFTASGTWTKPSNIKGVKVVVIGGGGGGGGGRGTNAVVDADGGGGGGGGGISIQTYLASGLSATETVTIGAGGGGAAGGTGANGSNGTAGGNSVFKSQTGYGGGGGGGGGLTANAGGGGGGGGNAGAGGTAALTIAGAGGSPQLGGITGRNVNSGSGAVGATGGSAQAGGNAEFGGGGGGSGDDATGLGAGVGGSSIYGAGGGGGGGMYPAGGPTRAGLAGGATRSYAAGGGGAGGAASGGTGSAGSADTTGYGGAGGGGGGSVFLNGGTTGGTGGAGGAPGGGGGGGGGAGANPGPSTGGTGGNGADGTVLIWWW